LGVASTRPEVEVALVVAALLGRALRKDEIKLLGKLGK